MTPTSPSTAAGSDAAGPPRALLAGWLRRAAAHAPGRDERILRGSLLLAAWCPDRARPAKDVDYLLLGAYEAGAAEAVARAIAALPDPAAAGDGDGDGAGAGAGATELAVHAAEEIWAETAFPGLRLHLRGRVAGDAAWYELQVDLGAGDPLSLPPRPARIDGAGDVLGCAPETLFAWKLHGLVEHGAGKWRAKDLYDLDLMWSAVPLERAALRPAVELAFSSRDTPLAALDDFRTRETWGTSRGGVRKWRALGKGLPAALVLDDFLAVRARVRAAVDAILA